MPDPGVRRFYPIGNPGVPWGCPERREWRSRQLRRRSYEDDVAHRVRAMADRYEILAYGRLVHGEDAYPLLAVRNRHFGRTLPTVLVTGGVHGYETSGVTGALEFLETRGTAYSGKANLLVVPCVSPWSYERNSRWTHDAVDPNRSFRSDGLAPEASALIGLVASSESDFLLHVDLHETPDRDEAEFNPALAARDGGIFEPGSIPDGFYLVADVQDPQLDFQQSIISVVEKVTHIAPPDEGGRIIGSPVVAHGVIEYDLVELGLCTSITGARYTVATEVYPDGERSTPAECSRVQVTAICAALDYALAHR